MSAKKIMIQGTMSNSGKSFLVAALCRIFARDGYKTAPFKSQNMALNSYVTRDGLEMGRAQVMQAEAAGIEPAIDMNPILLKPTSCMGSQVIINGEVYGNMKAMEYYRRKPEFIPVIKKAFARLEEEYDIIVLEGAGSPAEINLRDHDIVNMGMAKMAAAPVLLIGDIDRGGVFASLYGTVSLLMPEEQQMIKGLVINKFRGDRKILEPGLRMIEERLNIPVTGVIPMAELDLDDEDSLSDRLSAGGRRPFGDKSVNIAVIRFPHLSNFTDFNSLEQIEAVSMRYVKKPDELGTPDLIILPGTKNTMADLGWMREGGLETQILRLSAGGVPVIGICGGYQMLGTSLADPEGVEGGGVMAGMGLLDTRTVFSGHKTRTRITGTFDHQSRLFGDGAGDEISGYEIHMGVTDSSSGSRYLFRLSDGRAEGLERSDGLVFGSYLHGLFDNQELAWRLLERLGRRKGIALVKPAIDPERYKQEQYDKLADLVRASLDMDAVYRILNDGL